MAGYLCPVCCTDDPNGYLTCNRPDCPDGRDPRPIRHCQECGGVNGERDSHLLACPTLAVYHTSNTQPIAVHPDLHSIAARITVDEKQIPFNYIWAWTKEDLVHMTPAMRSVIRDEIVLHFTVRLDAVLKELIP